MKKRKIMKIVPHVLLFIWFYIVGYELINYNVISLPKDMIDYQFNIVTIVSVFAGFSFSVLGLLISLASTKLMKKLEQTNILSSNCRIIIWSIVMFMGSFFMSLYFLVGIDQFVLNLFKGAAINKYLNNQLYVIGLEYLFAGVMFFSVSVYKMSYMVQYIFADVQKEADKKIQAFHIAKDKFKSCERAGDEDEWD